MAEIKKIGFEDLRYSRETHYEQLIKPRLANLRALYPQIEERKWEREQNFFHLLSTSIRVDSHPMVRDIVDGVRRRYNMATPIRLFVYRTDNPTAMCTTHILGGEDKKKELIILVSQHFFNLLDYQERLALIAHEACHYLLGHLEVPAAILLNQKFELKDAGDIKMLLLKWSLCAEVSSDIVAMYMNDMRPKVFSNSIIKFSSGISALDSYDLIELLINQYDEIARDEQSSQLSLHPILPLRIKIVQEVVKTNLASYIGQKVSLSEYHELKMAYERTIDECVAAVYPEVTGAALTVSREILLDMGLAVGLANYVLEDDEIRAIYSASGVQIDLEAYMKELKIPGAPTESEVDSLIDYLINKSIAKTKESQYERHDLMPVMRFLLTISASDEEVEIEELNVIYRYLKEFGFSKHDIVMTLEQMHLEPYAYE